jgi:hypothetical protein
MGGNPFIFGSSVFGDGSKLSDKVDYFIGNILSDENGKFNDSWDSSNEVGLTLEVYGENIKSATIVFDTYGGGHPQKIYVDGKLFFDDDAIHTISNSIDIKFWEPDTDKPFDTHLIDIYGWSKPNSAPIIEGIYVTPETIKIDRKNILSIEHSIFDRDDIKKPSWGIISSKGKIDFKDINGEIKDYAENGFLKEGLPCNIYIESREYNLKQEISKLYTNVWEYDYSDAMVSVSVIDNLLDWQNEIELEYLSTSAQTAMYLLEEIENLKGLIVYDEQTEQHLKTVEIPTPYLEQGSKWSRINNICIASQCYIFIDSKSGYPRIKYYNGE